MSRNKHNSYLPFQVDFNSPEGTTGLGITVALNGPENYYKSIPKLSKVTMNNENDKDAYIF